MARVLLVALLGAVTARPVSEEDQRLQLQRPDPSYADRQQQGQPSQPRAARSSVTINGSPVGPSGRAPAGGSVAAPEPPAPTASSYELGVLRAIKDSITNWNEAALNNGYSGERDVLQYRTDGLGAWRAVCERAVAGLWRCSCSTAAPDHCRAAPSPPLW